MKIKTSELKEFMRVSSGIKTSEILPILSYLKFENNTVTKNNLQQFVIQQLQHKGSFLVLESILFNFISQTNDAEIEIIPGQEVLIRDSKITVKSPSLPVADFPINDNQVYSPVELPSDLIEAIFVVEKMVTEDDILPFKGTVFVSENSVFGSDGFVGAAKFADKFFPTMILPKSTARVIGGLLTQVFFSENDSYHFFHSGKLKFGFSKPEVKLMDFRHLFSSTSDSAFLIDKSELIKFNKFCMSLNRELPHCLWSGSNIIMEKSAWSIKAETMINGYCNLVPTKYNAEYMNRVLEAIPGESIKIHKGNGCLCITNEHGYLTLLMEIVNQN